MAVPDEFELITCPRMPGGLRLMPASCAANYRKGKTAEAWETTNHCKGCEIGAGHAGEAALPPQPIRHVCATCNNHSHRLVFNLLCVSCFNRLAEAMRGRNARGQVPKKWRPISLGQQVAVVRGGIVFVGRGHVRLIARAPGVMVGPQQSLFPSLGREVVLPFDPFTGDMEDQ